MNDNHIGFVLLLATGLAHGVRDSLFCTERIHPVDLIQGYDDERETAERNVHRDLQSIDTIENLTARIGT